MFGVDKGDFPGGVRAAGGDGVALEVVEVAFALGDMAEAGELEGRHCCV